MTITINPKLDSDKPIELQMTKRDGSIDLVKAKHLPIVRLHISFRPTYPSNEPLDFKLQGFYKKYEKQLIEILCRERWFPDQLVLYDWFTYC